MSGPAPTPLPVRWQPWVELFEQEQQAANRSPNTIATRASHLKQFALAHPRSNPLTVSRDHLVEWLAHPGWSPAYRRSMRATIRAFFTTLHQLGHRDDDPSRTLPLVREPRSKPRPCPDAAVRQALQSPNPVVGLAVRIATETGLRRAEIAALRVDQVQGQPGGYWLTVIGKGGHQRVVPIADALAADLLAIPTRYVFPAAGGGHLSPRWLGRLVAEAMPAGWTMHTLRHRFGTVAYRATGDLRAVQELMGHASVATTQRYTAVSDDAMRRAAAAARLVADPV
ncbi:Putative integrase (Phage integrase family protein) [Mycobacteroides abscessus subsp. abscessus]|uniref:tyrosine-type recombinase/integrase n=1 Tax=Mycobacteroides abscessus TaxID=36809 RepID=UPI000928B9BF|nr:tyrosine-type recombinase/integrase [Mycobacteroides abscessus]SHT46239.1 Putative integrase (Phage integrase family protein) [Mycobacteroides abscessus subsp. abscessus]SHW32577.1 Putative integrase (Phage integrase family protein) [Mycobacteroides abscessus subsp. abscessus]SIF92093.1 Putative integrase (Phage integrase family protein) [Mycobacteroides abscessus subsp. abscessus]SKD17769.1 Putative integrase (Phage integrase family protein) [Mycobacteroides abscessus subsp. abscessus]SKM2